MQSTHKDLTRLSLDLSSLGEFLEDVESFSDLEWRGRQYSTRNVRRSREEKRETNLGSERLVIFEQVEQFTRIHLQQHSGNLTSEVRLRLVDLGVEAVEERIGQNLTISNRREAKRRSRFDEKRESSRLA